MSKTIRKNISGCLKYILWLMSIFMNCVVLPMYEQNSTELSSLAAKYKNGLPIIGVPDLTKVNLTNKTLEHVFGIEVKPNTYNQIQGFHYYDTSLLNAIQPFCKASKTKKYGVLEGLIAVDKAAIPIYKTFFPSRLTKEDILFVLVQTLANIEKTEVLGSKRVFEGKAKNGMRVKVAVDKATNDIVTFYPITDTSLSARELLHKRISSKRDPSKIYIATTQTHKQTIERLIVIIALCLLYAVSGQ